jgi:hypothetical protein
MQPRIYTYKITFDEIPHWYWGVHKEKKYGETYLGSPVTHTWVWEFYTPAIEILEFFPYTDEGWKEANLVEDRIIRPDLNNPLCLNEGCGSFVSSGAARRGALKTLSKIHREKTIDGKSVQGVKNAKRMNEKVHQEKDENGKSKHAVKAGKKNHKMKNEDGKSKHAVEMGKKGGAISSKIVNIQVWESLVDGFRSNAGCVARHNIANGWDPGARVKVS